MSVGDREQQPYEKFEALLFSVFIDVKVDEKLDVYLCSRQNLNDTLEN